MTYLRTKLINSKNTNIFVDLLIFEYPYSFFGPTTTIFIHIYVVHSISFQTFCTGIWNCYRLLKIQYVICYTSYEMTDQFFYDFRFKWRATAGIEYTLLKPDCYSWWISKMQSGREEERYTIKFCFKLGKNAMRWKLDLLLWPRDQETEFPVEACWLSQTQEGQTEQDHPQTFDDPFFDSTGRIYMHWVPSKYFPVGCIQFLV